MENLTIPVYNFSELTEEVQDQVIEDNPEIALPDNLIDFDENYQAIFAESGLKVETMKLPRTVDKLPLIMISEIDFEVLFEVLRTKYNQSLGSHYKWIARILNSWGIVVHNHYFNTTNIDIPQIIDRDLPRLRKSLNFHISYSKVYLERIKTEIIDKLQEDYDTYTSKEYIGEFFEDNQFKFLENGTIANNLYNKYRKESLCK